MSIVYFLRTCSDIRGLDGFIPLPFFLSNLEAEVSRIRERRSADAPQAEKSVLEGKHFLCAEDNALNAEILQAMMEMKGASCVICHDGAEMVEKFKTVGPGEYDAILMDAHLSKPVDMAALERTFKSVRG